LTSLRAAIAVRLALVAASLALVLGGFSAGYYRYVVGHDAARVESISREDFARDLGSLDASWAKAAERLARHIRNGRIVEQPGVQRWTELAMFLAVNDALDEFSDVLVRTEEGKTLFALGADVRTLADSGLLARLGPAPTVEFDDLARTAWVFLPARGDWLRVLRLPLWLGAEGHGELLFTRPLTASVLERLGSADTRLSVLHPHPAPSAAPGAPLRSDAVAPTPRRDEADHTLIRFRLPWPGAGSTATDRAPLLLVERHIPHPVGLDQIVMQSVGVLAFLLLAGWLALGRWLGWLGRDIGALRQAADAFGRDGDAAAAGVRLAHAAARRDDLGATAGALARLMESAQAREAEQRGFVQTLSLLDEAVFDLAADGRVARASPGWAGLLSSNRPVVGQPLAAFIHGDDHAPLAAALTSLGSGEKTCATLRLRLGSEAGAWVELRLARDETGSVRGALRDISQTYRHEQRIVHMALHDALTGLPNRVLLEERIGVALRDARRERRQVAVGFIDLDNFKLINDGFGHDVGDGLLLAFAERVRAQLRASDTLARWGGDEFALLLPNIAGLAGAREVADKLIEALRAPFVVRKNGVTESFTAGASIGYALFPEDGDTPEQLLSRADRAMFEAKARGRSQACAYAELPDRGDHRRTVYLQNRLAQAIEAESIDLWFQPIVDAGGRLVMVEALARWRDKGDEGNEGGEWIPPAVFVPIAENSGLIGALGRLVWRRAVAALARWRADGHGLLLAVNLSKRQLVARGLADELRAQVLAAGLVPGDFVLEVTESVAMNDATMRQQLVDLHAAGFALALDDFGTGFSSLSHLHNLPLDEVKIDMSFVQRIGTPEGHAMVKTVIAIAGALRLSTIAEGVEDAATAAALVALGVDRLQGYHFARPLPAEAFEQDWLNQPASQS
jgi:diguanylate cyclase (GGDEF)-like protein